MSTTAYLQKHGPLGLIPRSANHAYTRGASGGRTSPMSRIVTVEMIPT